MKIFRKLTVCLAFSLLVASGFAQSHSVFANSQVVGPEVPSKLITVTVWLKQRNKAELDEMVRQMYERSSPTYHHWLKREEYRARFAPTADAAKQVHAYLRANNLTVTSTDKFNHYVTARGRVSDVESTFNVQLSRVNLNGHIHRISNAEATIVGPVSEVVRGVTGLDDLGARSALARRVDLATGKPVAPRPLTTATMGSQVAQPCLLTGPQVETFSHKGVTATYSGNVYSIDNENCSGYIPSQLQAAYGFNSLYSNGWDGTGQTIVIVDAYGSDTILEDANTFSAAYGLPALTSSNFQVYYSGGKHHCGKACVEANFEFEDTLDVEWAHATAPGANIVLVLSPDADSLDVAEFWAIENPEGITTPYTNGVFGYVISNSWIDFYPDGLEPQPYLDAELQMTELAAALGVSANFVTGDCGDWVAFDYFAYGISVPPNVGMPASSPYATAVGGTSLFLDGSNNVQYQVGWGMNATLLTTPKVGQYALHNYPLDPPQPYDNGDPSLLGFVAGSGGGTSEVWAAPSFQSSLGNAYRQIPDISFLADSYTGANVIQTVNGKTVVFEAGGTSLAGPMFSALWAIANQAAGTSAPLGQAAPMLYSLPVGAITDIVPAGSGSNVSGTIAAPPQPLLTETADDLAQPLENTTSFLSGFYEYENTEGKFSPWFVTTFGTDSSLFTAPGWDNVTGLGVPNGMDFVQAVVAAAP